MDVVYEQHDANTFASWEVDSLKCEETAITVEIGLTSEDDDCYSDAASGYPDAEYTPAMSPQPRYANMTSALLALNRSILFQICDWGVDFPALWAPTLGNTWRIANDITPAWCSIFRILDQAVPQTSFAGPGHWPNLDMLEVGNNVYTTPEEQTHFSMWAILKSPLTIGAALNDSLTAINPVSLGILKQQDVIGFNQDKLGVSASLSRRYTEQQYDVWSGPLSGGRIVTAVINWANESRTLTLNLPDIGVQHVTSLRNIWSGSNASDIRTTYSAEVDPHGTMLVELNGTILAGTYPAELFATAEG